MSGILYALITVFAWGTWLAPSQNVIFKNQQIKTFYVAATNLVLALLVTLTQDISRLTLQTFWPPFLGGLIWSVSGLCAFTATNRIGIARAFGIWAPLNIIVSIFWGAVIFHEFMTLSPLNQALLFASLVVIIAGVLMIILPKEEGGQKRTGRAMLVGALCAVSTGVLWGSYFIPIKLSQASLWVSTLPLVVGIFVGSSLLLIPARAPIGLDRGSDYLRVCLTGLLWGVGNYGSLLLIKTLGAGKGFTISQLSVVVNALVGVFLLKDPRPGTRAATLALTGCMLATVGGVVLGNLK